MKPCTLRRRVAEERGSVLITGLLLSIAVAMVIGLAVDVGHAFVERRDLSSIADDAALTGSQAIDVQSLHEGHLELNVARAREEAQRTIAATPNITGQVNATTTGVSITITRRVPTILLGLVGVHTLTITAHANAAPRAP
jgi:uncharacterized membrane protein